MSKPDGKHHEHFCWRCYPTHGGFWRCCQKPCTKTLDAECPKHEGTK